MTNEKTSSDLSHEEGSTLEDVEAKAATIAAAWPLPPNAWFRSREPASQALGRQLRWKAQAQLTAIPKVLLEGQEFPRARPLQKAMSVQRSRTSRQEGRLRLTVCSTDQPLACT